MKRVLFIAVTLLVIASCKSRDKEVVVTPPDTILEVEATVFNINHEAQSVDIKVICNEKFDVEIEAYWLRLDNIHEADGADIVTLCIDANDVAEERSAKVVIVAGELRHSVTITQSGIAATSMEVAIGHRNKLMTSPKWNGKAVSGTINWGDGTIEEYAEGAKHYYSATDAHTATFTMSGTTSFEIATIGAMDSLTIAID